jgi:hypothetical protein
MTFIGNISGGRKNSILKVIYEKKNTKQLEKLYPEGRT